MAKNEDERAQHWRKDQFTALFSEAGGLSEEARQELLPHIRRLFTQFEAGLQDRHALSDEEHEAIRAEFAAEGHRPE